MYSSKGAATGPLYNVIVAGIINRALGGFAVAPWEVPDLTPDVLDPIMALATELPNMRKGMQAIEAKKQAIRDAHARKVH